MRATGNAAIAAQLDKFTTDFGDDASISSWARGAINFAVAQAWLKGYEDESFRPRQDVTFAEAVTVLMRLTGHEATVPATAVWPVGHALNAHTVGLLAGVETNPAMRPLSREDMARLTYNALFIDTLELGKDDELHVADALGATYTLRGTVRAADADGQTIVLGHLKTGTAAASQQTYALADELTIVGAPSLTALIGKQVRVAVNVDDEINLIETLRLGPTGTGTFKQVTGGTADARTMIELEDGSAFSVSASTAITVNGLELSIGPGGMWPSVHAFLTNDQTGMRAGDLVTAVVDPAGNARSLTVLRFSTFDYVVDRAQRDTRRDVLTVRRVGSAETFAVSVDKTAVIDVNGHAAPFTDLAPGDTVRLAISGEADAVVGAAGNAAALWVSVTR